jgi:SpoVK/Ycf46/Vps4 family AAA+-type ATPase
MRVLMCRKSYAVSRMAVMLQMACLEVDASDIMRYKLGESEQMIEWFRVFVKCFSPCVAIINEIDGLIAPEGKEEPVLASIRVQLQKMLSNDNNSNGPGFFCFCTTNHGEKLPRPIQDRFSIIAVPPISPQEKLAIFTKMLEQCEFTNCSNESVAKRLQALELYSIRPFEKAALVGRLMCTKLPTEYTFDLANTDQCPLWNLLEVELQTARNIEALKDAARATHENVPRASGKEELNSPPVAPARAAKRFRKGFQLSSELLHYARHQIVQLVVEHKENSFEWFTATLYDLVEQYPSDVICGIQVGGKYSFHEALAHLLHRQWCPSDLPLRVKLALDLLKCNKTLVPRLMNMVLNSDKWEMLAALGVPMAARYQLAAQVITAMAELAGIEGATVDQVDMWLIRAHKMQSLALVRALNTFRSKLTDSTAPHKEITAAFRCYELAVAGKADELSTLFADMKDKSNFAQKCIFDKKHVLEVVLRECKPGADKIVQVITSACPSLALAFPYENPTIKPIHAPFEHCTPDTDPVLVLRCVDELGKAIKLLPPKSRPVATDYFNFAAPATGKTPLHYALENNCMGLAKAVLVASVNLHANVGDRDGYSPLESWYYQVAGHNGHNNPSNDHHTQLSSILEVRSPQTGQSPFVINRLFVKYTQDKDKGCIQCARVISDFVDKLPLHLSDEEVDFFDCTFFDEHVQKEEYFRARYSGLVDDSDYDENKIENIAHEEQDDDEQEEEDMSDYNALIVSDDDMEDENDLPNSTDLVDSEHCHLKSEDPHLQAIFDAVPRDLMADSEHSHLKSEPSDSNEPANLDPHLQATFNALPSSLVVDRDQSNLDRPDLVDNEHFDSESEQSVVESEQSDSDESDPDFNALPDEDRLWCSDLLTCLKNKFTSAMLCKKLHFKLSPATVVYVYHALNLKEKQGKQWKSTSETARNQSAPKSEPYKFYAHSLKNANEYVTKLQTVIKRFLSLYPTVIQQQEVQVHSVPNTILTTNSAEETSSIVVTATIKPDNVDQMQLKRLVNVSKHIQKAKCGGI